MARARVSWIRIGGTWLALMALAGLSLGLSFLHLGPVFVAVALVIAGAQATAFALSFMDLGEARFSVVIVPLAVLSFIALLVTLTAVDVATRRTYPEGPAPSIPEEP